MEQPLPWSSLDSDQWQRRVREAHTIGQRWAMGEGTEADDEDALAWLETINQTEYVGSRHHTVPRFLLEKWADKNHQVRVFHRIEGRHAIENVRDLAITDFYTVIDQQGVKNSSIESLLGVIERAAEPHINAILNPFTRPTTLPVRAVVDLVQFTVFQSVRTARNRRELELQTEWYAKTMAGDRSMRKNSPGTRSSLTRTKRSRWRSSPCKT